MIEARGLTVPRCVQQKGDIVRRAIVEPRRDRTMHPATSSCRYVSITRVANEVVRHLDRASVPNNQGGWGEALDGGVSAIGGPVVDLGDLIYVHRPREQYDRDVGAGCIRWQCCQSVLDDTADV